VLVVEDFEPMTRAIVTGLRREGVAVDAAYAIQHNVPGGQAAISTALTTAGAVITVSNTGTLVPPDAVGDLFQPFRQLGTERTRRGEGHGLGLAIVRAIADAHGAALTARSHPGGGLDIQVIFP
jgi:signal transduction histidine kinase